MQPQAQNPTKPPSAAPGIYCAIARAFDQLKKAASQS